MMICW